MDSNPFRIHTGQRLLRGLFYETTQLDKSSVVYTLKSRDHEGYPSLYRLYMEHDDPTEYSFAIACLDSWDHWETLCRCTWFKPYISAWRRELEIRTKAQALVQIKAKAKTGDKEAYQAQKFLISGGWKDRTQGKGAGRPSTEDVRKEAQRMAQDHKDIDDDFERIQGAIN